MSHSWHPFSWRKYKTTDKHPKDQNRTKDEQGCHSAKSQLRVSDYNPGQNIWDKL